MSWVLTAVVILNSSVFQVLNYQLVLLFLDSGPELGSSQKRYFGFSAIALAIATL